MNQRGQKVLVIYVPSAAPWEAGGGGGGGGGGKGVFPGTRAGYPPSRANVPSVYTGNTSCDQRYWILY